MIARSTPSNSVLQTLTSLQLSHQSLQDTIHHGHQDVDEEVAALQSQLNILQERPSSIVTTLEPGSPPPSVTMMQAPIMLNTPESNLKPAEPEAWNGTECDAKPFRNRVLLWHFSVKTGCVCPQPHDPCQVSVMDEYMLELAGQQLYPLTANHHDTSGRLHMGVQRL